MTAVKTDKLAEEVKGLVEKFGSDRSALLPILQEVQRKHKYIPDFAQQEIARLLDIHPVEVYSVISFYAFLNSKPKGKNIVRMCQTIVCDMAGKDKVEKAVKKKLGIKFGETTKDNRFTLEHTNCLGMCDCGPAMMVNDNVYIQLTPEKAVKILKKVG